MKALPVKKIIIGYSIGLCVLVCSFFIADPFPQQALNAKVFSEQETSVLDEIPFSFEEVATAEPVPEPIPEVFTDSVQEEQAVVTPEVINEEVSEIVTTEELPIATPTEGITPINEETNATEEVSSTSELDTITEETTAVITSEPLESVTPVLSDDVRSIVEQFSFDSVIGIQNTAGETVYVDTLAEGSLWLFNASTGTHQKIGEDASINTSFPIGVKDGILFWVSEMNDFVFGYNTATNVLHYQPLPSFDPAKGERAELTFPDTHWIVIVTHEVFYFYTPEVGEVFSDQNTTLTELLEKRFNIQLRHKEEEPILEEPYNENE